MSRFQPLASRGSKLLADLAVSALIQELDVFPKPGLVSPIDSGSHTDMDYPLLRQSANALRKPFRDLADAGASHAQFVETLIPLGIQAEHQMLEATGGVNTHRGAIFSMGLLVAAAAGTRRPDIASIQSHLIEHWGDALSHHAALAKSDSRPLGGARLEAAQGYPSIFQLALPHFTTLLNTGVPVNAAAVETLFLLLSRIHDTNVHHRGGPNGAQFARRQADAFLDAGGIRNPLWHPLAVQIHHTFIARNLSPGGAADLLAGTLFLYSLTQYPATSVANGADFHWQGRTVGD